MPDAISTKKIASSRGIETIQGNAFDAIARPESFSRLYLNPPYDSEIGSVANNRLERLFLDHTESDSGSQGFGPTLGEIERAGHRRDRPDRCASSSLSGTDRSRV
jgi:hypothetical protein